MLPGTIGHTLAAADGGRITFFRGDSVSLNFSWDSLPEGAAKLRVLAKNYVGLGRVGGKLFLASEAAIAEGETSKAVEFSSSATKAPAGEYLLCVMFVDTSENILVSAAGILELVESGVDEAWEPPENFTEAVMEALANAQAAQLAAEAARDGAQDYADAASISAGAAERAAALAESGAAAAGTAASSASSYASQAGQAKSAAESAASLAAIAKSDAEDAARAAQDTDSGELNRRAESAGVFAVIGGGIETQSAMPDCGAMSVFITVGTGYSGPVWTLGDASLSISNGSAQFAGGSTAVSSSHSHAFVATFDGTNAKLYVDGIVKITAAASVPSGILKAGGTGSSGTVSRIKAFNFDCSASGAPYTVNDYNSGLEESPLLRQCPPGTYFENDPEKFTGLDPWGSGTAVYDGTDIVISGFNTETYGKFSLNFPQKMTAGSRVRVKVRFESANSATYQLFLSETSVQRLRIGDAHDGEDFEWEGVCPYNALRFYVQAIATWQEDEYRLVSSDIEVLGPVLSLADCADSGVVRDLSGAKLNAILTGNAAASKQNNPALAHQKISWAGTATTQNICGVQGAPADSIVTLYAYPSSALTLKTKTATHAEVSTDLPAKSWTLISTRTTTLAGVIIATPTAAFTGSVDFSVKIERLK